MSNATYRESLRSTLAGLMAEDDRIFVIGEDVGVLGGAFGVTAGLLERFGSQRVLDAPISETAILGAAIGAALVGMRPIVEMQFVDFMYVALDQLLHQAALAHFGSGGVNTVPLVIRANYAAVPGIGPQDTATLYGALLQFPGLTVIIPTTPSEAATLLRQAVQDPNPVLFLEPRELYDTTEPQIGSTEPLPLTSARVVRSGDDVTCIAAGGMVRKALSAADSLANEGVSVEVMDLRCVMPIDEKTVLQSVGKTGQVLVLDVGPRGGGLAAEVLAMVAESELGDRVSRVRRLTSIAAPIAYAPHLAAAAVPDQASIAKAIREIAV